MTIKNPEFHDCECGFRWAHGKSGDHNCGPYYRETIRELRAAAAPQVVADERELPEMTDDRIFEWAEGYVFTLKGMPHKMTFSRPRFVEAVRTIIAHLPAAAPVQLAPAQAIADAEMHGIGFLVDGVGVDPSRVTVLRPAAPVQPVAVPDGWKLVPVELTREMLDAWENTLTNITPGMSDIEAQLACASSEWKAMLTAAPAAPAAQGDAKDEKAELVRAGLALMVSLKTVKDELEALKGDAKDAERYRWIKANITEGNTLPGAFYLSDEGTESWDRTIDAAIAAKAAS